MSTSPLRTLTLVLVIFASIVGLAFEQLYGYFLSNPFLNGIVVSAMMTGILYITIANVRLARTINLFRMTDRAQAGWLRKQRGEVLDADEADDAEEDEYAEDYTTIMEERGKRLAWLISPRDVEVMQGWSPNNLFSAGDFSHIMSSARLRIAEVRNFSNYFSGVLVILGLLGTFLGLLETIKSIGLVFSGDSIKFLVADKAEQDPNDILAFFDAISEPLAGMGIAFSSSLFGLSGSLVVGLLAFVSARNQSFFMFDLFDWFKDRADEESATQLDRNALTALPSGRGLMGSLGRSGVRLPQAQVPSGGGAATDMRPSGAQPGGVGGDFRGEFRGEFRGDSTITGKLDANSLLGVMERLERLMEDAIEKNGLLAKAALKLGENLALEQKRLADIATYEQQSAVSLAALRQQGDQQVHLMNQMVEAAHSNTDREEFRALAAHFHRSFSTLSRDINDAHNALATRLGRIGIVGMAESSGGTVGGVGNTAPAAGAPSNNPQGNNSVGAFANRAPEPNDAARGYSASIQPQTVVDPYTPSNDSRSDR